MVVDDEAVGNDSIFNKKFSKFKNPAFLTANTKQAFIQLRQTLTKRLIVCHFNLKCHICIKINVSSYAINSIQR